MSVVGFGFDPDGKEFRAQVAGAGLVEADVPDVFGIGVADVEVLVQKALRRVGVSIDDDRGVVDGARPRRDWLRGQGCRQQQEERKTEEYSWRLRMRDKGFIRSRGWA